MGCSPSSQISHTNDNETRLLLEIDRLRTGHQSQEQEIDRLRQENEKLKQKDLNGTFEITDTHDDHEKHNLQLVKEIERLTLEKEEKDKEIYELRQNNEELHIRLQQSPQVALPLATAAAVSLETAEIPTYKAKNIPKVGDPADSPSAIRNHEVSFHDRPPSYDEAMLSTFCDPREIRYRLEGCGVAVNKETQESGSLIQTVKQIESAKVFVACLSDDYVRDDICRQEFLYAKKTARKPVIPIVVGSGSFEWTMTVVGLLIAGEIYIHFQSKEVEHAKMSELLSAIKKSVPELKVPDEMENIQDLQQSSEDTDNKPVGPADVFVSYCWSNSEEAFKSKQVKQPVGSAFADPRKVHSILAQNDKFSLWIDTDQLKTTNQNDESLGMFAQIADGLGKAKVVLACVSKQYANSENCRMEIQFAIKSLKKPVVPVIVGEGNEWESTVVGLLVAGQENLPINLQDVNTEEELQLKALEIEKAILPLLGLEERTRSYRAPVVGDHVISHHNKWAFFGATIASFNRETMTYTVNWDDGDPTDRVQSYRDLGLDEIPTEDQVGVDSVVFFPQGSYGATEGNNSGGMRFHQGIITRVWKDSTGLPQYDGHHTKGEDDGKWVTYGGYQYNFTGIPLNSLRIAPNAMDALMACQEAFS